MPFGQYILGADGEPELCDDMTAWGRWMRSADRHVASDWLISERYGMVRISTVFLGIDHAFDGGQPILFETMIFREKGTDQYGMPPPDDLVCSGLWGEMRRYRTRLEAVTNHAQILATVVDSGWTHTPFPSLPESTDG